jgi:hypothetical protein
MSSFYRQRKEINQLNEGEEKPHSCKDVMFASISLASAYKGGTSRNYHVIKASFQLYIYNNNNEYEGDVCYYCIIIF